MAKPIEPTPPLSGQDARNLLDSLEDCAAPEEIRRRQEEAKQYFAHMDAQNALHEHKIWKKHAA